MIEFRDIRDCPEDLRARVREWRNRDFVRSQMTHRHPIGPEEHARFLASLETSRTYRLWVVFLDGAPAATANLQNMDPASGVTEWGFYIGEPGFLGKGWGRRILEELLRRIFLEFGFRAVRTKVLEGNAAARALYGKLGFRDVGAATETCDGEALPLRRLEFTRDEWERAGRGEDHGGDA